jgi:hypothetical protein
MPKSAENTKIHIYRTNSSHAMADMNRLYQFIDIE